MATGFDTRDALCTLTCSGLADDALLVTHWTGEEGISQPYRFTLTVACTDLNLDIGEVIGREAMLSIGHTTEPRRWHGIVTGVRDAGFAQDHALAIIELEPRLSLLRRFRRSDVYLGKSIADIIRTALAQAGLDSEGPAEDDGNDCHFVIRMPESRVASTQLGFVCQFEETTLDFLSRRLEREGVYYWFEPRGRGEAVVFGDATDLQPQAPAALVWRPDATRNAEDNDRALVQFRRDLGLAPARVRLDNFAASRADLDLSVSAALPLGDSAPAGARPDALGEIGVYGEHYSSHAAGERLAAVRAQALACQADRYQGESRAPGLRPGGFATVQDHVRSAYDGRYAILEVEHEGSQPLPGADGDDDAVSANYRNQFVAIEAQHQYRTDRRTRWPRVIGLVSAIVDSESDGAYAELDANGCYHVRFPFAQTDHQASHNSAPVRMATPYAGDGHGMHLPLLKGTEVLVSFVGGDPDRPIILGAVNNSERPNMLDGQSASRPGLRTAGGNALAFEDRDGQQSALLGSPVGESRISFGAGEAAKPGISMRTLQHVDMRSSSYEQNVPGIYRMQVVPLLGGTSEGGGGGEHDEGGGHDGGGGGGGGGEHEGGGDGHEAGDHESAASKAMSGTWWNDYGQAKTEVGMVINTIFGSETAVCIGNSNDLKAAVAIGIEMQAGFKYNLTEHYTVEVQGKTRKVEEEVTIAKISHKVGNETKKIIQKKEEIGEYECKTLTSHALAAGSYSLEALDLILQGKVGTHNLTIGSFQASLSGTQVSVVGTAQTTLGRDATNFTKIKGGAITVGDPVMTSALDLKAQFISMKFLGSAALQGDGALSLSGGIVRLG